MKKIVLSFLIVLIAAGGNAFACPTTWKGPYVSGGFYWYDYTLAGPCYTPSGSVTGDTVGCAFLPGWRFGDGWSDTATTSFTLDSTDPILDPTKWSTDLAVDLYSPAASWWDQFQFDVIVRHPNGTQTTFNVVNWNGTMGSMSGCIGPSKIFTATTGDTITMRLKATNLSSATIKASVPRIFNGNR